jgi:hypothetical protein
VELAQQVLRARLAKLGMLEELVQLVRPDLQGLPDQPVVLEPQAVRVLLELLDQLEALVLRDQQVARVQLGRRVARALREATDPRVQRARPVPPARKD